MKKDKGPKCVQVKEGYKAIRIDPHPSTPKEISDVFTKVLKAHSEEINAPVGQLRYGDEIDTGHYGNYGPYGSMHQTKLSHEAIEVIIELHRLLRISFKAYGARKYEEGVTAGKNALFQLNNGTLSMEDFNDKLPTNTKQ